MALRTVSRFATLLTVSTVAMIFQSGCAGQSTKDATTGANGDKQAARELYAGQSSVVHATEYPVSSAAEGILRGDEAWRNGNLDLAVYLYVQSIAYDASAAAPFLKIGSIHEKLGNRALAQRAFELALERDSDNAAACERLGLLYLNAQRTDAARALFERSIQLDPERWQSHNGLGIAADRRGDFSSAIAHYDTAQALESRSPVVANNRGYSRYLAGDLSGAEADFRQAIKLGGSPGTWTNLGKVLARQGRTADALESLLKENDAAAAFNLLGEVALQSGDLVGAREQFSEAIRASPRYFQAAQNNLAVVEARIAEAGSHATRVTQNDANVYAKGAVIGKVSRGRRVAVLHTQGTYSLVKYKSPDGPDLTGWVASANLSAGSGTR